MQVKKLCIDFIYSGKKPPCYVATCVPITYETADILRTQCVGILLREKGYIYVSTLNQSINGPFQQATVLIGVLDVGLTERNSDSKGYPAMAMDNNESH